MLGRMRGGVMLAALAMMGAAALPTMNAPPPTITRAPVKASRKPQRRQLGMATSSTWYGRKGAGISMAQQKRTAAKHRNVARNRRSHR